MILFLVTVVKTFLAISFVLGSIALVHEFGHYITAKLSGIWVIEFAIGFGNRLFRWRKGETLYSLRPFPLGGFVRLAGMETEEEPEPEAAATATSENGEKATTEESKPAEPEAPIDPDDVMPHLEPDDPRGFPAKSRKVKLMVLGAGSFMNMVWAIVLFIMIYAISGGPMTNIFVQDVSPGRPAAVAGLRAGDIISAVDGAKINDWSEGVSMIKRAGPRRIILDVVRNHPHPQPGLGGGFLLDNTSSGQFVYETHNQEIIQIPVTPEGAVGASVIGISLSPNNFDYQVLPLGKAVQKGIADGFGIIGQTIDGLLKMLTRQTKADVAGPVKIMKMIKDQSSKGLFDLLYLTAILSVNIGLINMMPLPVLDGGRMVFVLLEGLFSFINSLTGWKLVITPKFEERVHLIGLLCLLSLLILVTYQDIKSFF